MGLQKQQRDTSRWRPMRSLAPWPRRPTGPSSKTRKIPTSPSWSIASILSGQMIFLSLPSFPFGLEMRIILIVDSGPFRPTGTMPRKRRYHHDSLDQKGISPLPGKAETATLLRKHSRVAYKYKIHRLTARRISPRTRLNRPNRTKNHLRASFYSARRSISERLGNVDKKGAMAKQPVNKRFCVCGGRKRKPVARFEEILFRRLQRKMIDPHIGQVENRDARAIGSRDGARIENERLLIYRPPGRVGMAVTD